MDLDEHLELMRYLGGRAPFPVSLAAVHRPGQPLVYVNRAFTAMTGFASEAIIGTNCRFLQQDQRDEVICAAIRETIAAGRAGCFDLYNRRHDGELFFNRLVLAPLPSRPGSTSNYCLGLQRDLGPPDDRQPRAQLIGEQRISDLNNPLGVALAAAELPTKRTASAFERAVHSLERFIDSL